MNDKIYVYRIVKSDGTYVHGNRDWKRVCDIHTYISMASESTIDRANKENWKVVKLEVTYTPTESYSVLDKYIELRDKKAKKKAQQDIQDSEYRIKRLQEELERTKINQQIEIERLKSLTSNPI